MSHFPDSPLSFRIFSSFLTAWVSLLLTYGTGSVVQAQPRPLIEQLAADESFLLSRHGNASSPEEINRMLEFYSLWRTLAKKHPFEDLGIDDRIDVLLLTNYATRKEAEYRELLARRDATGQLVPFLNAMDDLLDQYSTLAMDDPRKLADLIDRTSIQVDEFNLKTNNLALSKNPEIILDATRFGRLAREKLAALHTFHAARNPIYRWWINKPFEELESRLDFFSTRMDEDVLEFGQLVRPKQIAPLGRDRMDRILERAYIASTVGQLLTMTDEEIIWCENELDKAAQAMGSDNELAAVTEISNQLVRPEDRIQFIEESIQNTIEFIDSGNLVTIPQVARETCSYLLSSSPRPVLEETFRLPTAEMGYREKLALMQDSNRHVLRAHVIREFVPGHHLRNYMNQRFRPYRRIFGAPITTEGWAAYCEKLLLDHGIATSLPDKIGLLYSRKRYCVMALVTLKYHSGQLNSDEAVSYLREKLALDKLRATQLFNEIILNREDPLYHASFLIGAMQFERLHRELVKSGKMSDREFHDAVLQENNIPVELLRAKLLNLNVNKTIEPIWQFHVDEN